MTRAMTHILRASLKARVYRRHGISDRLWSMDAGMLKPRTTIDRAPRLLRSRARGYIKPTWAQRKPMPKNRIKCCCRDPLRFRFRQQTRSTGRASVINRIHSEEQIRRAIAIIKEEWRQVSSDRA